MKVLKSLRNRRVLENMRLMVIRNGQKQTISVSGKLELLQMVLEPDTGWWASKDAGPQGIDCEIPHRLEMGTKHFFVLKSLLNRPVLKPGS